MRKKEGKDTCEFFWGGFLSKLKICIDNLIGNNKGFKLKYIIANYILCLPTFPVAVLCKKKKKENVEKIFFLSLLLFICYIKML